MRSAIPRWFVWSWRTRLIVWGVGAAVITFGPIVQAAWTGRHDASEFREARSPAELAARDRYLAQRDSIVDRLLPSGAGGTRFYGDLGQAAGMAFQGASVVGLSVKDLGDAWPETTEVHERAHLVEFSQPREVGRLMMRIGAPSRDEYAAKNASEHFAEMAARAWTIVAPPGEFCVDDAVNRLRDAEGRVPGTSGFVLRFLDQPAFAALDERAELRILASAMSAPARADWDAIWQQVDARRRPDGTFTPWPTPSVRSQIESRRDIARASPGWMDRSAAYLLRPSLFVLSIGGR